MTQKDRRSVFNILRSLPPIFDIKELMSASEMSRMESSQACVRWKAKGYIKQATPRKGIYYNHFTHPGFEDVKAVLDRIIRLPYVVIGASALRHAGWSTQFEKSLEIGAPANNSVQSHPEAYGVTIALRPVSWIEKVWPTAEIGVAGIPTLPPEFALVDSILSQNGSFRKENPVWDVAPDDITPEIDEPEDVIERCWNAAQTLDAPWEIVRDFLEKIPALADHVDMIQGVDSGRNPSR